MDPLHEHKWDVSPSECFQKLSDDTALFYRTASSITSPTSRSKESKRWPYKPYADIHYRRKKHSIKESCDQKLGKRTSMLTARTIALKGWECGRNVGPNTCHGRQMNTAGIAPVTGTSTSTAPQHNLSYIPLIGTAKAIACRVLFRKNNCYNLIDKNNPTESNDRNGSPVFLAGKWTLGTSTPSGYESKGHISPF